MADYTLVSDALPPEADSRLAGLLSYWESKRAGRAFPSRKDIEPLDIPRLLPFITLVDVQAEPPGFVYRLVGTAAAEILKRDVTGQPVGTGVKPEELDKVLGRYRLVAREGVPLYHRTRTQEEDNDYTLIDRLMLPLGEHDSVTKILSIIVKVRS